MKRGNTALKRGVAIAAAFTTAIAGAVLAAPAASAASVEPADGIRALPVADSAFIDPATGGLITKLSQYNQGSGAGWNDDYAHSTTGAVPVISVGSGQLASSVQVAVPASVLTDASNDLSLLISGATFTTRPSIAISKLVDLADLDAVAGYKGSTLFGQPSATEATAATSVLGDAPKVKAEALSTESAKNDVANFTIGKGQSGTATGTAGYIVTISNIQVTVADGGVGAVTVGIADQSTLGQDPVAADVIADATAVVAFVSPFTVTAADGYPANVKGDIDLPDVTITEANKKAFAAGDYSLAISGDAADDATLELDASNVTVTPSTSKLDVGNGAGKANKDVNLGTNAQVTLSGAQDDAIEAYTISGLKVSGLKQGATVTLSLVSSLTPAASTLDDGTLAVAHDQVGGPSVAIAPVTSSPRLAGDSRYETAAKIAAAFGVQDAVILANGLDAKAGYDALSANFLAGAAGVPILLTDSGATLPDATRDALVKLFKDSTGNSDDEVTIYVAGKSDSVSDAAVSQAKFVVSAAVNKVVEKVNVVRFDGANRYETSAKIVTEAGANAVHSYNLGEGLYKTAFLASGAVNADALAAGSLSAGAGLPVLLAGSNGVDEAVVKAIKDLNIKQLIVLGGSDRISDETADGLKESAGIQNWTRVAGEGSLGRYDTASKLYTLAFAKISDKGLGQALADATAYLANGSAGFADALAVGPLAGKDGVVNPLLTVPADTLPASTEKFLKDNKADISAIEALGKSDRIADSVITAAQKAIL